MTSADSRTPLSADFHRHITQALSLEWQLAVSRLPDHARPVLREPGFALHVHASFLGQWVGAPVREIRLQASLVTAHPWYAVVDVLKHEMAHQFADEVLGVSARGAHGEAFQRACRLLGANPAASGRYPTLDEVVLEGGASDNDRIMVRIRKLLALAESPNRHEAERAMAKARQLMARHNVSPESSVCETYVSIRLGRSRLRHGIDRHALASLVRDACFVKTIWVPTVVLERGRVGRALEVSGTSEHVQMAHYVHDFVNRVIDVEWRRYRGGRRFGRNGRRDFALGVIDGFRGILDKQAAVSPEIQALIRRGDPGLDAYYAERYPRTRRAQAGRGISVNSTLIEEGKESARRVGFRPGVDARQRDRRRRLRE